MTIAYDPHQAVLTNRIIKKSQAITSGKFRLIFPTDGPFYSDSVELYQGTNLLKEGRDYLLSHIYPTSILRTARRAHGALWLINDALSSNLSLTAHYLGIGKATTTQITNERVINAKKIPARCYWEDVIGVVYFPPVDIQFNRGDWKGEKDVMDALGLLAKKLEETNAKRNPFEKNKLFDDPSTTNALVYNDGGSFICNEQTPTNIVSKNAAIQSKGIQRISWGLKSSKVANTTGTVRFSTKLHNALGACVELSVNDRNMFEMAVTFPGANTRHILHTEKFPKAQLSTGVTVNLEYDVEKGLYAFEAIATDTRIFEYRLDLTAPPSELILFVSSKATPNIFNEELKLELSTYPDINGELFFFALPGQEQPIIDPVYEMLVHWKDEIDEMFRKSPAITHVSDTKNPHRDTWGWLRAIEFNSIASDTLLVDGRNQSALAAAINAQLPRQADLTGKKLLRHSAVDQTVSGTFKTYPGQSSITGSKTTGNAADLDSVMVFDPSAAKLLSKGGYKVSYNAPNGLRFKAGLNVFELLPNQTKATWNGKELLTPLTVGPHLPGGALDGDGLFYGVSTPSVEITGNGINGVPFVATWIPPEASVKTQHAMRRLTDAFGYSETLAATPALVKQLDSFFTGKLLKNKASINGKHSLSQSVMLSKIDIGLQNVSNVADENLAISTAQKNKLSEYSPITHTHTRDEFGIEVATTAKIGLVKYGSLVNDDTLALTGDHVLSMYDRVEELENATSTAGVGLSVEIIRYGQIGDGVILDQATFTGAMLVIKKQVYYLRKKYTVESAAFNLSELFPNTVEDGRFYIYVDMKDNTAFYFVTDNPVFESDTITMVGHADTVDSAIVFVEIRNVTRLGDFRELDEHIETVDSHINYRPSSNELTGPSAAPVSAENGLSPQPAASWLYDNRYGYSNDGSSTSAFTVTAVQKRTGTVDLPLRLSMEYYGFSPDDTKVDWWSSSNMRLQYRIVPAAKRVEIWLLGSFGSATVPSTYIRHAYLPSDYLGQPMRITVEAGGNSSPIEVRNLRFILQSGKTVVLDETFNQTPSGQPLNANDADWNSIFNAAGTVNLSMPINPKGSVKVSENSFEKLRPVDFQTVKATVDVPGVIGMVRSLADWRCIDSDGEGVSNLMFSAVGQQLRCDRNPDGNMKHRILKQICPLRFDNKSISTVDLLINVSGGDETLIEVVLGGFEDSKGRLHRFSLLINNSNFITNPEGKLVVLGFAIDYATPGQVIIGMPTPIVTGAFNWVQLGEIGTSINFGPGQTEAMITIRNMKYIVVFTHSESSCMVRFSPGEGNNGFFTITYDLKPTLSQLGLSTATLFGVDVSQWWGIGGTFDGRATFDFDHSAGQSLMKGGGTKSLTTFTGFLEHLSAANAVRIFEETIPDSELSLRPVDIKNAFIRRHIEKDLTGNTFAISPDAVRITLDIPNKRLQAVVFRL